MQLPIVTSASNPRDMITRRMALTPEQRKSDLVERLMAEARGRVGADETESVEQFVRRYFALVAPDDIIYTPLETLLGGALSLWEFGRQRTPGKAKVRIFNPTAAENGWALEHTVIEIVNDDMPFLVDSVSMEINRRERSIHLLLHPVVRVRRDEAGRRVEMTSTQAAPIDAIVESMMHIEIDQETSGAELEMLRGAIERVLTEVRVAVADWRTMRQRLAQDVAELEHKLPMPQERATAMTTSPPSRRAAWASCARCAPSRPRAAPRRSAASSATTRGPRTSSSSPRRTAAA